MLKLFNNFSLSSKFGIFREKINLYKHSRRVGQNVSTFPKFFEYLSLISSVTYKCKKFKIYFSTFFYFAYIFLRKLVTSSIALLPRKQGNSKNCQIQFFLSLVSSILYKKLSIQAFRISSHVTTASSFRSISSNAFDFPTIKHT